MKGSPINKHASLNDPNGNFQSPQPDQISDAQQENQPHALLVTGHKNLVPGHSQHEGKD